MEERFIDQTLDAHAGGLLYLQLESVLKQRMQGGDYAVGDRIPTEPELCEEFGVSRITVRRAIQDLVDEGLLKKIRGRGTFVAVPKYVVGIGTNYDRGFGELNRGGMHTRYEIIGAQTDEASVNVAERLGLEAGTRVTHVRRLVLEGDVPFAIDDLYVSAREFPGLSGRLAAGESFYALLESAYGVHLGAEDLLLDASTARRDEARLLRCAVGVPLFVLRKRVVDVNGFPIHYSKSVVRAERFSYRFSVACDGSSRATTVSRDVSIEGSVM